MTLTTCSTNGRRGSHAAERAFHCRRASDLRATRRLAPCCSKTERPGVSMPPSLALVLPGALPSRARTPELAHHGRRRRAPVPPLLPRLQPSCACTARRYASVASRRPSCAPFSVTAAAGAPSPPVPAGSSHRLLWPRHHRPRRAKLGSPACAHGPLGASPSLPRRRRTFSGRNSKLRPSSALFFRLGT